jgi:hypothetical protein
MIQGHWTVGARWVTINGLHLNVWGIDRFYWERGELVVVYHAPRELYRWKDPHRRAYERLCQAAGVTPEEAPE